MNMIYEIGIFMISETKIDNSFLISQLIMTGYSVLFRLDRKIRWVEKFCFSMKIFPVNQLKLTVILTFRGFCGDKFKNEKMVTLLFLQST